MQDQNGNGRPQSGRKWSAGTPPRGGKQTRGRTRDQRKNGGGGGGGGGGGNWGGGGNKHEQYNHQRSSSTPNVNSNKGSFNKNWHGTPDGSATLDTFSGPTTPQPVLNGNSHVEQPATSSPAQVTQDPVPPVTSSLVAEPAITILSRPPSNGQVMEEVTRNNTYTSLQVSPRSSSHSTMPIVVPRDTTPHVVDNNVGRQNGKQAGGQTGGQTGGKSGGHKNSTQPQLNGHKSPGSNFGKYGVTAEQFRIMKEKSIEAKSAAYCPYSHFQVGACILTSSGIFIKGANVENAAYPVGTCAERVAFGKAVTEGHREFKALAVATNNADPASPCGMCRQFVREFCPLSMPIFMFGVDGTYIVKTLEELLPMSFGPEALPPPPTAVILPSAAPAAPAAVPSASSSSALPYAGKEFF